MRIKFLGKDSLLLGISRDVVRLAKCFIMKQPQEKIEIDGKVLWLARPLSDKQLPNRGGN